MAKWYFKVMSWIYQHQPRVVLGILLFGMGIYTDIFFQGLLLGQGWIVFFSGIIIIWLIWFTNNLYKIRLPS